MGLARGGAGESRHRSTERARDDAAIVLNAPSLPPKDASGRNHEHFDSPSEGRSESEHAQALSSQEFTLEVSLYLKGERSAGRLERIVQNIFSRGFSDEQLVSMARHLELESVVLAGGQSFLAKAFVRKGSSALLRGLASIGIDTFNPESTLTYFISPERESISQRELVKIILDKYESASEPVRESARKYFELLPSPYQLYLYLDAAAQLRNLRINDRSLALFQIATNMLYIPEAERPLRPLVDLYKQALTPRAQPFRTEFGFHPNAAELMLLANPSPEEDHLTPKSRNYARSVFKADHMLLWAIERIGSMTFSFSRFKHDARQVRAESGDELLSRGPLVEFGGEYINNPDRVPRSEIVRTLGPQPYGPQIFFPPGTLSFKYSSFDQQRNLVPKKFGNETTISLRQGYYLVENPNYGLLFIRNSSPEFGRSLLSAPAQFLDYSAVANKAHKFRLSREDILYPSPQLFELARSLEGYGAMNKDSIGRLNFLLDELQGFFQQYNRWKFDTS